MRVFSNHPSPQLSTLHNVELKPGWNEVEDEKAKALLELKMVTLEAPATKAAAPVATPASVANESKTETPADRSARRPIAPRPDAGAVKEGK